MLSLRKAALVATSQIVVGTRYATLMPDAIGGRIGAKQILAWVYPGLVNFSRLAGLSIKC